MQIRMTPPTVVARAWQGRDVTVGGGIEETEATIIPTINVRITKATATPTPTRV